MDINDLKNLTAEMQEIKAQAANKTDLGGGLGGYIPPNQVNTLALELEFMF